MNKKWIIIWLTLIFALFLVLAIFTFIKKSPLILLGAEVFISGLYIITIWVLNRVLKPINIIGSGLNMLREGDFNITMSKTGSREIDNIIEVYNSMITRLREGR
jgi:nitrate/nitrite-specific signal transduction histidine kinase